jgi:DNA-binding HxlR family transcriptional regulator
METHRSIVREVANSYPVVISYNLTPYAASLKPIINALKDWGQNHKQVLFKESAKI